MRDLAAAIPDIDIFLALTPEELAAHLLFILRRRRLLDFTLGNLMNEFLRPSGGEFLYPPDRLDEIELAMSEAWAWLVGQGLLVPKPPQAGWYRLSRRAERFEDQTQFANYAVARLLQRDMLHHSIAAAAWQSFMRGEYATAVFQAMRQVEIAVREAAGFASGEHGVPMIRRAFGRTGPLTDPDAEVAEQDAVCALFAGAVGTYKNPHSHRHVLMESASEAAEIVMMGSHLLRVVDQARRAKLERERAGG